MISIVICTFERVRILLECLDTILRQSQPAHEVIVIDNSLLRHAITDVIALTDAFASRGTTLRYVRNEAGNNLPAGRNHGVRNSRGSIVLFLDDDVLLDNGFLAALLAVYDERPEIVGVQGVFERSVPGGPKQILKRIFRDFRIENDRALAYPSVSGCYPGRISEQLYAQWFAGFNQSYRRRVFDILAFDEKLSGYGDNEDFDFSVRVRRHYGANTLLIDPRARLIHRKAPEGRSELQMQILMEEVYSLYLYKKLYSGSWWHCLQYTWTRIGRVLRPAICSVYLPSQNAWREVWFRFLAYAICLRDIKAIQQGFITSYATVRPFGTRAPTKRARLTLPSK